MNKPNPPYNRWLKVTGSRVRKVRLHRNGVVDVVVTGSKPAKNRKHPTKRKHAKYKVGRRRRNQGGIITPITSEARSLAKLFGVPFEVAMRILQQTGGDVQMAFNKLTHLQASKLSDLVSVPVSTAETVLKQVGGDISLATKKLIGGTLGNRKRHKRR